MTHLKFSNKTVILIITLALSISCFSQTFTEQTGILLTGVVNSSVAWGDYDNDGNLDILLTGYSSTESNISKIFRNNGDNTFTEQKNIMLIGVTNGSVAWGDYDNDGYLDILLTGATNNGYVSKIYRNNGDNSFTEQTGILLPGVMWSSVAWGDYDNDGNLDILLTGYNGSTCISKIYRNNGYNNFTEQTGITLTGVYNGSVAWGDYDNDGDLDLLLTGYNPNGDISKIYRNNGDNSFTEQTGISLTGVENGSVAWGDYDHDGYLDLLLTGQNGWPGASPNVSKIYHNNGNNTFAEQTGIALKGVRLGSAIWGDSDNDGDLDILLTGSSVVDNITSNLFKIYQNNGDNTFAEQTGISFSAVTGSVAWGDYDNDGDLDILLCRKDGITKIYRNECMVTNTAPSTPTGIEQTVSGRDVILKWKQVTSDTTPAKSISYNVRVGTTSNAINTLSPQASDNGFRRISAMGNAQLDTVFNLKNLKKGAYYWSVQAIDNSYKGGAFSIEGSFTVSANEPASGLRISEFQGSYANVNWYRGSLAKCIVFIKEGPGDFGPVNKTSYTASSVFGKGTSAGNGCYCVYNGTGDFVKITGLKALTNYSVMVYEYDGTAGNEQYLTDKITDNVKSFTTLQFTEQTGIVLTGASSGTVEWGDYDNDGNLDILVTGLRGIDYGITKVYRNNGDNTFTEQTKIYLPGQYSSTAKWGDYNNDGLLDIILSGQAHQGKPMFNNPTYVASVYRNNGDGTFTEQTNISLPQTYGGVASWVDYDNDGCLDLFLIKSGVAKLYRNNCNGGFTEQTGISFDGHSAVDATWGDYNNDGYSDILIRDANTTKIYMNNGNNTFTEQTDISLPAGSGMWGDYNNDGFMDLLFNGNGTLKIYSNNGNNTFTEQTNILFDNGAGTWGDYDNDGFLDVLLVGSGFTKIYRNNGDNTFTEQTGIVLAGLTSSYASWGDYNNDGNLDVAIMGCVGYGWDLVLKIYSNDAKSVKVIPDNAPVDLKHTVFFNGVTLNWTPNSSSTGPGQHLSYNVKVFTKTDSVYRTFSQSATNGFRKVVALGNAQLNNFYKLENLKKGTYYWQVQSVDKSYQGGAFSDIDSFVVKTSIQSSGLKVSGVSGSGAILKWKRGNLEKCAVYIKENGVNCIPANNTTYSASTVYKKGSVTEDGWYCVYNGAGETVQITGLEGITNYAVEIVEYEGKSGLEQYYITSTPENLVSFKTLNFSLQTQNSLPAGSGKWGDYNNDGYLDILLTKTDGSKIYRNNGDNTFSEQTAISLIGVSGAVVDWGDYNNDGFLDILLTGYSTNGGISKIYCNNGDNTFTEQTDIVLAGVYGGSACWGDYDNDGFLDILLVGSTAYGTRTSKIYHNNGNNSFTETNISIPGVENGSASWCDYDNDGYLDILITGNTGYAIISKIFRNNGDKTFSEQVGIGLKGVYYSVVAWGDYNNDGYQDILITGDTSYGVHTSKIYKNNGDNTFTEQTGIFLTPIDSGFVLWIDYDNDGDLDIFLSGPVNGTATTKVYRNNGDNSFTEQTDNIFPAYCYYSMALGDYDNDGDMDILFGNSIYRNYITRNQLQSPNKKPLSPRNLTSSKNGSETLLSWTGDTTDETSETTMTYNVAIGKTKNSLLICSPNISNGQRTVTAPGNAGQNNFYKIRLDDGKYYWGVQAVDGGFVGGNLSAIDSVEITTSIKTQINNLSVSNINNSSALLHWKRGTLSKCVLFVKEGEGSFTPVNNITYTASPVWGMTSKIGDAWYCIYNGTGETIQISGLNKLTKYTVEGFEYDGTVGLEQYLAASTTGNKLTFQTANDSTVIVPRIQTSNLIVSKIDDSSALLHWTRGNLNKCVLFAKEGKGSFIPENNTTYSASATFGQNAKIGDAWYCIYNGTEDSVQISGLSKLTNYTVEGFEYEGNLGSEQYMTNLSLKNKLSFSTRNTLSTSDIFPNPVRGTLTVVNNDLADNPQLYIYSIDGSLLFNTTLKEQRTDINMVSYENGIYILKILSLKNEIKIKIIKM